MKRFFRTFMKYRYLLFELIKKDIKLKYRRSVLGLFWTLLEPLLTMFVLWAVFGTLYGKDGNDSYFMVYILTGRLMYTFFSNGTKAAMKSIRVNSSMIKKVYVPKYIYPLSSLLSNFVIFVISLIVLVGVSLFVRVKPSIYLLLAWVPILILLLMCMGIGMILSTMAVFFRDMEYLWTVACMLIFYCSAVFYQPDRILRADGSFGWIFKVNPLYCVIRNFRDVVLYGQAFDTWSLIYSSLVAAVSLLVGTYVFYKKQDKFILNI